LSENFNPLFKLFKNIAGKKPGTKNKRNGYLKPRSLSNSSAPSRVEKKAPHLGHFIFVVLAPSAHPMRKADRIANAKMMLFHLFILTPTSPL
jgi:hypothetical protein